MISLFTKTIRPQHHLLLCTVSLVVGQTAYNTLYFQDIIFVDLFVPSLPLAVLWGLSILGCYTSWIASSYWISRHCSIFPPAALDRDIVSYTPLYLLAGTWLNHIGVPVGLFLIPALTGFLCLKLWNGPMRRKPPTWSINPLIAQYGLAAGVLAFAATFAILGILRYHAFRTFADFTIFIQQIWGFSQFKMVALLNLGLLPFGNHFSPALMLLTPFYWIWEDPRTLVILHSTVMALGAIPIYLLVCDRLQSPGAGLALAGVYLFYPAIQQPAIQDFHESMFLATPLLYAFLFLQRQAYGKFLTFCLLAIMCKEDASIPVGMMGFYLWWKTENKALGWSVMGVSLVWLVLSIGVVMPYYQGLGGWYASFLLKAPSSDASSGSLILTKMEDLLSTDFITFMLQLLVPLGGIPLLAPIELLISLPTVLELTFYNGPPFGLVGTIYTWHTVAVVPGFFIATVYGLEKIKRTKGEAALTPCLMFIVMNGFMANLMYGVVPYAPRFSFSDFRVTEHDRIGRRLLEKIPPQASVTTTSQISAHLGNREFIYLLPIPWAKGDWRASDEKFPQTVDYVVADTSHAVLKEAEPASGDAQLQLIRALCADPRYSTVAAEDGYVILKPRDR
ncbi:MAG: DUF2079 domain-containing protein [candidate division Zixibacteria bacterium]|nr:DUF2079 domain-containing protein [candidate division Zixibacteria bacterium]